MSDKGIHQHSSRVSVTTPIVAETPCAEGKGEKGAILSFAQHVNALRKHDRRAIRKYLPKNFDELPPKKQRKKLGNALDKAIAKNDIKAVKAFIKCGVDVNKYNWRGVTPLFKACEFVHVEIVEILLSKGADPNILAEQGNQWAPLHYCIADHQRSGSEGCLTCAKLLLDHGADVNRKTHIDETPLHFVKPDKQPELVTLLLSRGANPLTKNSTDDRPKLRPRHFQGLGPHLTAALQNGKRRQVDRWITVVKKFPSNPQALSLLVEWAPLCINDEKLSKRIHTGIERCLSKLEGDPPLEVLRYVAGHNARESREEVLLKLATAKLKPIGIRNDFSIVGDYSAADHGLLLIELASSWALDPEEDHMLHVMAILKFVASSAENAPRPVRIELHNAVVKLLSELHKSDVRELVERASYFRDFLGKAPFALDTPEQVQKQQ